MTPDPVFRPVRELAELVRTRRLSPVALAETFLDRLETLGGRYNAVVTVTRARALAEARRAEEELAAGRWRGPLHGIPYGAKDLLATAGGIPTTCGAAPLRGRTLDHDATVIRKLGAAGAVLVAKLAMVELAGGAGYRQPNAAFTGPGVNPWRPDAWTGGSSSGSAAAVAAGLVPFALGSETWGSILSPAACCGVTGLRPTLGRVSRHGAFALSWTLDKLGPLGLTADDCGLVLEAIAGPDPLDPAAADRPFRHDPGPAAGTRRLRFGVVGAALAVASADVQAAVGAALDVLRTLGDVDEVVLPDLPYEAITRTILFAESASALEDLVETGAIAGLTAPEDRYALYARDAILAKDYIRALRLRGVVERGGRPRPDAVRRAGRPRPGDRRAAPRPGVPERLRRHRGGPARRPRQPAGPARGGPAGRLRGARAAREPPAGRRSVGRGDHPGGGGRLSGAHGLAPPAPTGVARRPGRFGRPGTSPPTMQRRGAR